MPPTCSHHVVPRDVMLPPAPPSLPSLHVSHLQSPRGAPRCDASTCTPLPSLSSRLPPAVTMWCPEMSTARADSGPRWHSILTTGVLGGEDRHEVERHSVKGCSPTEQSHPLPKAHTITAATGHRARGRDTHVMFGVHIVTQPFVWPRCSTALCGFWRITEQGPSRVLCCATMAPWLVSWYRRMPARGAGLGQSTGSSGR